MTDAIRTSPRAALQGALEEFLSVRGKTRWVQAHLRCKRVCLEACTRSGSLLTVSALLSAVPRAEYLLFLLIMMNKKEKRCSVLTASVQAPAFTTNLLLV